jgi:ABC-type multidrug transport system fused ATPase/permease subunit
MANNKQIESLESLVSQLKDSIAANKSEEQIRELITKFEQKVEIQKKANKGFDTMLILLFLVFVSLGIGLGLVWDRNDVLKQKITNMEYRDSLFNQIMQPDSNSTIVYRVRNGIPVTYNQLANESDSLLRLTHDIEHTKEVYRIKLSLVTRNYPVSFTEDDGIITIHSAKIDSALLLLPVYRDKISFDSKQRTWCVTRTDYK